MRRVSSLLAGVVLAIVASNVAVIPTAQAGLRRCDQNRLYGADIHYAKRATTRAMGKHIPDWSTFYACTNAESAWSWAQIQREPQPDGSTLGGSATCGRGASTWTCDFGMNRLMLTTVTINGAERKILMDVPLDLSARNITRLLQQSIDESGNLQSKLRCKGDGKTGADESQDYRDGFADAFRFYGKEAVGEIQDDEDGIAVVANDHLMVFTKPTDDESPLQFVCWAEQIVVA